MTEPNLPSKLFAQPPEDLSWEGLVRRVSSSSPDDADTSLLPEPWPVPADVALAGDDAEDTDRLGMTDPEHSEDPLTGHDGSADDPGDGSTFDHDDHHWDGGHADHPAPAAEGSDVDVSGAGWVDPV